MSELMDRLTESKVEVNQKYLDMYWSFIFDRHIVWYKRFILQQKAPWTKDPILLNYKFTNVYRELDKGTVFLLHNIVNGPHSEMEEVFNIIVYRMFNRIDTYESTGFLEITGVPTEYHWDKQVSFNIWRNRQNAGLSLYTDAHMVCAYEHFPGADKLERFEYIFDGVFKGLPSLMNIIKKSKSLETIHKALMKFPGIGPFLAYEIAVDISYCEWNNHGEDEWANPGPGCQRGLKKIFPNLKTGDCTWMITVLRQAQKKEFKRLGLPFEDIAYKGRELTLRNIEHCLCEFSKMEKALTGTGRPRNRFKAKSLVGSAVFKELKG